MSDAARTALQHIREELRQGAVVILNDSGGQDSQAMQLHLLESLPGAHFLTIHATLGEAEWPGALEHAKSRAEGFQLPFAVVSSAHGFLDLVQRRHERRPDAPSFPSPRARYCTSDLKTRPIEKYVRAYAKAHGITRIINSMGLRAQESPARAKKPPLCRNVNDGRASRTWLNWLPIHGLSREDVNHLIQNAGSHRHPAYELGNERLSCVFCIFGSKNDLINGARHNPELYEKYVHLERRTGSTLHVSRKTLPELTGIQLRAADKPSPQ